MNIKPLSYYQTNTEWQVFDRKSVRMSASSAPMATATSIPARWQSMWGSTKVLERK